jgi:peroxiredoxin-like protein
MTQTVTFRPKTFTYRTSAEWLGKRNVRFSAPTKSSILVSNPPEFRGDEGFLTPEELFIGAVETCLLISFAALVEKHKLPVEAYYSEAEGILEDDDGHYRFTRVIIRPTIVVTDASCGEKVCDMIHRAHQDCLIGNSQRAEIVVKPDVVLAASE